MIEKIMTIWNGLSLQTQHVFLEISKLGLLIIITLICINKLKKWFVLSDLDECFKFSPLKQEKTTPTTTWLSTGLAYGLCLSVAVVVHNKFILEEAFWSNKQNEILVKFWGSLLFYLLLMCLFKQVLVALSGLLKNPAIENYIEIFFGRVQNNQSYKRTEPLAAKVIHYTIYTIYFARSRMRIKADRMYKL